MTAGNIVTALKSVFDITELGDAKYFLSMEIERDRELGTLKLSQKSMTTKQLERYGLGCPGRGHVALPAR